MNLGKIVKLTDVQYKNLSQGTSVGTETGIVANNLYEVDNTKSLLDLIYPVGAIYMSTVKKSPAEFLGGNWIPFTDSMMLKTSSSTSSGSVAINGGSDDVQVPAHNHSMGHDHGSHSHSGGYTTGTAFANDGNHQHQWNGSNSGVGGISKDQAYTWGGSYPRFNNGSSGTGEGGDHSHTFTAYYATAPVATNGITTTTTAYTGNTSGMHTSATVVTSGTGLNVPVYKNVYMWMRAADNAQQKK